MSARKKLTRSGSRRLFKATTHTRKINTVRPMRGGFRL